MFLQLFHEDAPFFVKNFMDCLNREEQIMLSKVNSQMIHIMRSMYTLFCTTCNSLALFDDSFFVLNEYEHCFTKMDIGWEIKELYSLEECTQLTELDFSSCEHLDELDEYHWENLNLSPLIHLTKLDLSYTRLTELHPLRNLMNLTQLDLSVCDIWDRCEEDKIVTDAGVVIDAALIPLQFLTKLTELNLSQQYNARYEINTICLQPLACLTQLTKLDVSGVWKTHITSLFQLTQLKTLKFGYTYENREITPEEFKQNLPTTTIFFN